MATLRERIEQTQITRPQTSRYDLINRYSVSIASLRNRLKRTVSVDELAIIASKIIDLENRIMAEKNSGCKELEIKRATVEERIKKLRSLLRESKRELRHINKEIDAKIMLYRKELDGRIMLLKDEYNNIIGHIDKNFIDVE